MLEAIMVISFIYGIRYLMLFNRPMDKLDAGDITFINKQRKKKQIFLTVEEVKATFKKRGIGMLDYRRRLAEEFLRRTVGRA